MTKIQFTTTPWTTDYTSTFDILFKDFYNTNSTFISPVDNKIGHPVDIYENKEGLFFEIACTGLTKSDVEISVEGDVLKVTHTKSNEDHCCDVNDCKYYHKGLSRKSFNLGYKIAPRFDMTSVDAKMDNGLLTVSFSHTAENKPTKVKIK
jgi:HSP20 family molecular chaperone IbpA